MSQCLITNNDLQVFATLGLRQIGGTMTLGNINYRLTLDKPEGFESQPFRDFWKSWKHGGYFSSIKPTLEIDNSSKFDIFFHRALNSRCREREATKNAQNSQTNGFSMALKNPL